MDAIIEEIFVVARAHDKPLNWNSSEEYKNHFYTKLVPPTAKHFPSMYYDVKAGKRLEIDALNGAIVRLAREKGIAVPVNETITRDDHSKRAIPFPVVRINPPAVVSVIAAGSLVSFFVISRKHRSCWKRKKHGRLQMTILGRSSFYQREEGGNGLSLLHKNRTFLFW